MEDNRLDWSVDGECDFAGIVPEVSIPDIFYCVNSARFYTQVVAAQRHINTAGLVGLAQSFVYLVWVYHSGLLSIKYEDFPPG